MGLFKDKYDFIEQYKTACKEQSGKEFEICDERERYYILGHLIASKARTIRSQCAHEVSVKEEKRVYYFSMEFLIGRLMENYLMNFGIRDLVAEGLADLGVNLDDLSALEADAGLGNGGLGRLAACFIDSMASLSMSGAGMGIRYQYGLFRQEIENGCQIEKEDNWLKYRYPWEVKRPDKAVVVRFGGEVVRHQEGDKFWYTWENSDDILAVPYDIPIVGFGGETVNTLRLWSAEPIDEKFDMDAFNNGDYSKAMKHKADVLAISTMLYPNDKNYAGKILRLKQEYMFVAAGVANIVIDFKRSYGTDWKRFPDLVAIHTNDTHPALCGPELLRILIDEEGLDWDTAWDIVTRTISYTNHTILPEAMEKWPIDLFRELFPRVYDFIEEIDRRYRESFDRSRDNWQQLLKQTAILWDGQVRMANLSIIVGHSVNGVAALHTDILKKDVLKEFYALTPEKFNNKTNGISHRRFLAEANPSYSKLITDTIGDGWYTNADEFEKLSAYENDSAFLEKMAASKRENKIRLAEYIKETSGVIVNPDSVFDVQVKRFHAYKRQLLNVFKVMDIYNQLLDNPEYDIEPTTFIFAGKAAQGYDFAKDVIRLVNSVGDVINNDSRVNDKIKVAFIPNFAVSNAQLIYPAADISEQISTAGMEASGTGNMKFMMNGAITLGTLDGANVEIAQLVGDENIEIFGLRTEEIEKYKMEGSYYAWDEYHAEPRIKAVLEQLVDGTYEKLSGNFKGIYDSLLRYNDEFFILKDFMAYIAGWHNLTNKYKDKNLWYKMALHNTAKSGFFSSDRTIKEYAKDIWNL